jgi:hypothetical protein
MCADAAVDVEDPYQRRARSSNRGRGKRHREFRCGRSLENFNRLVTTLKSTLQRFMDALSGIDQCFIADDLLERLPAPSVVGKSKVGGIDLTNRECTRSFRPWTALSASPDGFTAFQLAAHVRTPANTTSPSTVPAAPLTIRRNFAANRSSAASADPPHPPG